MAASALEDTHDYPASAAALEMASVCESPKRRIAWAIALSALLHAVVLLTLGLSGRDSARRDYAPEPRLSVELQSGRDTEHDQAGPVERPAAPTVKPREELAAASASRWSGIPSPPGAIARVAPAPAQNDSTADATQADGSVQSDSPPEETPVVTTQADSDRQAAARVEGARQQVALSRAQQSRLAQWVIRAAQGLQDAGLREARLSLEHEGRRYVAALQRRPVANDMDIEHVNVEITTQENGRRLRTWLHMKRLALSHFAQLVDRWDDRVQFHGDAVVGRFHSNSQIIVGYDRSVAPRFLGKVTTTAGGFGIASALGERGGEEMFPAGIETRARRIALPDAIPTFASEHGIEPAKKMHSIVRDTRITFYPDGSYGVQELGSGSAEQRRPLSEPTWIVGGRRTAVYVRGTVCGKVLVYSPERIVIEGSLVYAHDPRSTPDADDYLGLLSGGDVEIARPEVTGPGDLAIHAAVYARRRFLVSDEDASPNGTLSIYGSVTAGSLSATEPRYVTKYEFDRRFEQLRPPGFPLTNRYEIEAWDAAWRQVDDDRSGAAADP